MATVETSATIKYKDSSGNTNILYPKTLKNNVSGMEEVDAHLTDKNNPHEVTAEQVGALSSAPVSMASTDGTTYTCTVPGITSLTAGAAFIGIPARTSTYKAAQLNVNGLGAKLLRRRVSTGSATTASGYNEGWLAADKPLKIMYNGNFWVVDITQPHADDLMGSVPVAKGGTGATTAVQACSNLGALSTSGGTMSGAVDMSYNKISNLAAPTDDSDAATKKYVDERTSIDNLTGVVPIDKGGTGNTTGYITTGKKEGTTLGSRATVEGSDNTASGKYSHAEGFINKASEHSSHAEGYGNTASGHSSHAEGYGNTASGQYSHAEGSITAASGQCSHAEGSNTAASGQYSHAEGSNTAASGQCSHAEGYNTIAGEYSHAEGYSTTAGPYSHVSGKYNKNVSSPSSDSSTAGSIFIVGNGTSDNVRTNAFRITAAGECMGTQSFTSSGADYAEYFEWADGNLDGEDRRGHFVTLDGEKIRIANDNDDYILGVISARPSVIGDGFTDQWKNMYLTDVFGENITETVEVPESTDEKTGVVTPAHTDTRFVLNPEYDHTKEYIGRELRKEWAPVGLVGKLVVVDDGTCEVNGYCKVAASGGATKSMEKTPYRVMSRLDDTHIRVFMK